MKSSNLVITFVILTFALFSCKPIYKCGEIRPVKKLFYIPKIVQNIIDERDSLCTTLTINDNDISNLRNDTSNLKTTIKNLEKQYSNLLNDNNTKTEQFSLALKQKSDELIAKEKLLAEREGSLYKLKKDIAHRDSITARLNGVLRNALLGFRPDELSVEIRDGKVYVSLSEKLLFKSGSAAVESKGVEAIKVLADVLNKNPEIDILVEGHTDNVPIKTLVYRDNWDLSVARAISIVHILTNEYTITPTRLTASGRGEFAPKATNFTPEGRAANRRTEIILSPKLGEIMKLLKN
jgi:chemotaxis protein MotB